MNAKVSKGITVAPQQLHPRDPRSPGHAEWVKKVSRAMRQGKARRRKAGLLTLGEMVYESNLPLRFIKRALDSGELACVRSGSRRYVHRAVFERWFGKTAAEPAA